MKRRWCLSIAMVALAVLVVGCAPAPAPPAPAAPTPAPPAAAPAVSPEDAEWAKVIEASKREGKVMLYTFMFTEELPKNIERAFGAQYPWIKLDFLPMASSTRVERIKAEQRAGAYIADTSDGSPPFQWNLAKTGMSQPVGDLPALKDKAWKRLPKMDDEGYLVGVRPSISGIWYNTTVVKLAELPKSMKDMLDPKWTGKIIASEPGTSNTMPRTYTFYTRHGILDDNYYRKLGPQLKFVIGSTRDITRALARGEGALGFVSSSDANPLVKEGAPIKPIDYEEGPIDSNTALSMVKNAPHPNATRVFINWLLTKEGQAVIAQTIGGFSMREDVADFTPEAVRLTYKKLHYMPIEDYIAAEEVFSSRKLVGMWGRK